MGTGQVLPLLPLNAQLSLTLPSGNGPQSRSAPARRVGGRASQETPGLPLPRSARRLGTELGQGPRLLFSGMAGLRMPDCTWTAWVFGVMWAGEAGRRSGRLGAAGEMLAPGRSRPTG